MDSFPKTEEAFTIFRRLWGGTGVLYCWHFVAWEFGVKAGSVRSYVKIPRALYVSFDSKDGWHGRSQPSLCRQLSITVSISIAVSITGIECDT